MHRTENPEINVRFIEVPHSVRYLSRFLEHLTFNQGVIGSSPIRITNIDVVQLVECGIWDAVVAGSSPVIYT